MKILSAILRGSTLAPRPYINLLGALLGALLGVFGDTDVPDDEIETFAQSFEAADTGTAVGRNSDTAAPAPAERR